jgi:tetratricopeptide (TPR) repeat protein
MIKTTKVKRLIVFSSLITLGAAIFALPQMTARANGQAWFPYDNTIERDGKIYDLYGIGGGADLNLDMSFLGFLSPYLDLGFGYLPTNFPSTQTATHLLFLQGGAGLSLFYYPIPRLMLRAGGSGGASYVSYTAVDQAASPAPGLAYYWKAKAEAGYRFSPTVSLLLSGGFTQVLGSSSQIFQGISAGVMLNYSLDKLVGATSTGIETKIQKQDVLFPIGYYKSTKTPLATVSLRNGESGEIRDVKVAFSAGAYTSRAAECGSYPLILRGKSVEVPIYANFNEKVLGFTETTKLQGEIKVSYKILDASMSSTTAVTVTFNNRNAATWGDERVVGAFVSPQDPSMLELSKYIAGLVRVHSRAEIDKNLQYGMGLFEGLRVYGLTYTPDPTTPYTEARKKASTLAYLQYPYQTLSYKSGDADALALTVAEALTSVAVPAAIAALPEDVIVAFPLDMNEAKARTTFTSLGNFIFQDDKVWVPLRASLIRDGFLRAWQAGAELWYANSGGGRKLVPVDDDWKEFQPIALADVDFKPVKPAEDAVNQAFENTLSRFVTAEVQPKAERLLGEMQNGGTGRQRNNLGIVYAQYGLYAEAKAEFEKAVAKDYTPAIVNLANIAFLLKDFQAAADYFQKALELQPTNKAAIIGLARAKYELDNFADADDLYAQVKAIDPALAGQYSYLASKVEIGQALRASSAAADRGGSMTWDKNE